MRRRTPMLTGAVIAVIAGPLLVACGGGSEAPAASGAPVPTTSPTVTQTPTPGCRPGFRFRHHVQERIFCGPARVRFIARGRTVVASGGTCIRTANYVALHVGTVVLGTSRASKRERRRLVYFDAVVGRPPGDSSGKATPAHGDGRATLAALIITDHGRVLVADLSKNPTATLRRGRSTAAFNVPLRGPGRVRGSWSCGSTS
jgi:hypothetical protein